MSSEIQSAPEGPLRRKMPPANSPATAETRSRNGPNWLFNAAALIPALLASSCCIPQLVLNAFSFGCAGFAALTPFRPFFLALTAVGVAAGVQRSGRSKRAALLALLTCAVAFSDVALRQYNEGALQRAQPFGRPLPHWLQEALSPRQLAPPSRQLPTVDVPQGGGKTAAAAVPAGAPTGSGVVPGTEATIVMTALNINCAACAARIKAGLAEKFGEHVQSVEVYQKNRAVLLRVRDQASVSDQAVLAAMDELKSPASIVRRDIHLVAAQ